MGNFLNIFFNPGHFPINNNNPAESESDSDDENMENVLIPIENQVIDHNYTAVLTNLLDIEENAVLEISAAIQRELNIYHFKIFLPDSIRAQHGVYNDFENNVNVNDIQQYIVQNYITECCANPAHASIRRMHGSIFLNSIPDDTFNPDEANNSTHHFLSPVYISPFINALIFGERYSTCYVNEELHPWIYCTFAYYVFFMQYYPNPASHIHFVNSIAQIEPKLYAAVEMLRAVSLDAITNDNWCIVDLQDETNLDQNIKYFDAKPLIAREKVPIYLNIDHNCNEVQSFFSEENNNPSSNVVYFLVRNATIPILKRRINLLLMFFNHLHICQVLEEDEVVSFNDFDSSHIEFCLCGKPYHANCIP